jgi:hypothetical protein
MCVNRIAGVMVSVLASSAVDRGLEHRSGQTKDYKISICCFSAKHTSALRSKSKDWLGWNQSNVSEWSDIKEEQTTQWPNEKVQKDKQRSTNLHIKLKIE